MCKATHVTHSQTSITFILHGRYTFLHKWYDMGLPTLFRISSFAIPDMKV